MTSSHPTRRGSGRRGMTQAERKCPRSGSGPGPICCQPSYDASEPMHSSGCVPCRHFGLNRVHHSRYAKVGEMCLGESQLDMVSVTLGKTEEPGKSNRPLAATPE